MYLESFGNPRRFTGIAKRVGRKKPILIVKSGRTEEGARAASSHTGAIAGADVPVSAFLEQCGVIRANTIDELFDIATALDRCPLPFDRRIAIVTNAGGPAIMATDACVDLGLEIAELSPLTRQRLEAFLPKEASVGNPVDMIASATAENYARALGIVQADDNVDMVMVINVTPLLTNPIDVLDQVAAAMEIQEKPVVAVMMATEDFYDEVKARPDLPPVYRFPESAARALAKLYRYSAWRRKPEEISSPEFAVDDARVSQLLTAAGAGYLADDKAFEVLELYGIPVAPWRIAEGSEEVTRVAAEIGYPVVIKAMAPGLVHKSDVGAVQVDLRNEDELLGAVDEIRSSLAEAGHSSERFLLQNMVRGGHEVIFGISTDPRFGPLLMFGLGGRYVEVFRDVRFGVTPLTASEALEMIRGIRGFELLEGVRGEAPADLDVLTDVLLRLAQLAVRHPQIQELDINPFLAAASREESCALDARIRVGPSTVAPPAES
jgi:acyl-CoA synthetase (NDP forming)